MATGALASALQVASSLLAEPSRVCLWVLQLWLGPACVPVLNAPRLKAVLYHPEIKPSLAVQRKGSRIEGLPHSVALAMCGLPGGGRCTEGSWEIGARLQWMEGGEAAEAKAVWNKAYTIQLCFSNLMWGCCLICKFLRGVLGDSVG